MQLSRQKEHKDKTKRACEGISPKKEIKQDN